MCGTTAFIAAGFTTAQFRVLLFQFGSDQI